MNFTGYEILIPVLTFLAVVAIGASIIVSRAEKRKIIEDRLEDRLRRGILTAGQETETAKKTQILQFLEKVGNVASHGNPSTNLWEQLVRAGYYNSTATAIYTGIKFALFLIGLVASAALLTLVKMPPSTKVTLVLLTAGILFFLPNLILLGQLRKRRDELRRNLPEAIDLLEICVSSGLGLDMAWNIVADEIQNVSPILANAMALANFEMHLGMSRVEAMRHMSKRTGVDDLSSLAAILIQTDRFGTSVADTLRIFAQSMREERSHSAQENAEKMAVRLLIPMILFIFPAVLITVVGPAVISMAAALTSGG